MTTVTLEEAIKARKATVAQVIQAKKLEMQMKFVESDAFMTRELINNDITTIDAILTLAEENYTADGRKLSVTFGYGNIPNKLITMAKSILYAKEYEKDELLFMANTDISTVEILVDALGQEAYFSKTGTLEEEIPMDIEVVVETLQQIITDLQLVSTISFAKFSEESVAKRFERARVKAMLQQENYINYISDVKDVVYID